MAQPGEVPRQLTRHWTVWSWWDPGRWRWAPPLDTPSIVRPSTVKLDHSKEIHTSPLRVFAIKSYDTLPKRETGAVIDRICVRIWENDGQGMVPAWGSHDHTTEVNFIWLNEWTTWSRILKLEVSSSNAEQANSSEERLEEHSGELNAKWQRYPVFYIRGYAIWAF